MIKNPTLPPKAGYVEVEVDGKRVYKQIDTGVLYDGPTMWPLDVETARTAKEASISQSAHEAIKMGMDVETSAGKEHFSLTDEDQINLNTALDAIEKGAAGYPYHSDKTLCRLYSAEEIRAIAQAAIEHKLYHTTLCNHLLTWVRRAETIEEIESITYSTENLPEDLAKNMADIFTAVSSV